VQGMDSEIRNCWFLVLKEVLRGHPDVVEG
jgi:hypothetical protein